MMIHAPKALFCNLRLMNSAIVILDHAEAIRRAKIPLMDTPVESVFRVSQLTF